MVENKFPQHNSTTVSTLTDRFAKQTKAREASRSLRSKHKSAQPTSGAKHHQHLILTSMNSARLHKRGHGWLRGLVSAAYIPDQRGEQSVASTLGRSDSSTFQYQVLHEQVLAITSQLGGH